MIYDPQRLPEVIDFENAKHKCLLAWNRLDVEQRIYYLKYNLIDTFIKCVAGDTDRLNAIRMHIYQYGNMAY